ncbi:hypothetical protein BKA82DRAFT_1001079, partial [Pisolithus tinctorius]
MEAISQRYWRKPQTIPGAHARASRCCWGFRGTIVSFSPDNLGVCEKLRLAPTHSDGRRRRRVLSHRLFKSDPRPHYGEGD